MRPSALTVPFVRVFEPLAIHVVRSEMPGNGRERQNLTGPRFRRRPCIAIPAVHDEVRCLVRHDHNLSDGGQLLVVLSSADIQVFTCLIGNGLSNNMAQIRLQLCRTAT